MVVSGTNTYSGSTTVAAGTLQLVAPGSLQNANVDVTVGTFLHTAGTNNVTGTSPGSGNLAVAAAGTYRLEGGTLDFQDYSQGAPGPWAPSAGEASTITLASGADFEFVGGSLLDVSRIVVTGSTFEQSDDPNIVGTSHFYVGEENGTTAALTTINGGYSLLGGVLDLDVFGPDDSPELCCDGVPTESDQLTVSGAVLLDSTIDLHFQNDYQPVFGDIMTLICASGLITLDDGFSINGGFFRLVDTGLGDGFPQYALQAIVPEPASVAVWTLVGLACATCAWRMRKRRLVIN
jgi:autotransporter-associated beta strand protein